MTLSARIILFSLRINNYADQNMLWTFELKNVVSPPLPTPSRECHWLFSLLLLLTHQFQYGTKFQLWSWSGLNDVCMWTCDCMCVSLCVFLSKHYLCVRRNWHKFNMQIIFSFRFERQMRRWRVLWAFFYVLKSDVTLNFDVGNVSFMYSNFLWGVIVSTQYW